MRRIIVATCVALFVTGTFAGWLIAIILAPLRLSLPLGFAPFMSMFGFFCWRQLASPDVPAWLRRLAGIK